jgi:undecaprenyl-diphosphatase
MTAVSLGYPKAAPLAMAYAGLMAYSRVYCGAHYPLDVAAGALLGMGATLLIWRLSDWVGPRVPWAERRPRATGEVEA